MPPTRPRRPRLSHIGAGGAVRMVDVSAKPPTNRHAVAEAWVHVGPKVASLLKRTGAVAKGDVFQAARIAGILAAKNTAALIPLCHPLGLDAVDVALELAGRDVHIVARATTRASTGVEMEAMTAAAVAALTVYDMVKSAAKGIEIGPLRLLEKRGGKSGHWKR